MQEKFGDVKARALFSENPFAAFEGRELPYVPEIAPDEKTESEEAVFVFLGELDAEHSVNLLWVSGAKRHARPYIYHAEDFAHDIEDVSGRSPPMHGIEGIVRRRANDDAGATVGILFPESVNAARVGLRSDDNHKGGVLFFGFGCDGAHFVGGIADRRCQRVNIAG